MSHTFAHLHLHTQYSLLEGAIRITVPDDTKKQGIAFQLLPDALLAKGFDACAITDKGNLFGAIEFYKTLRKAGIKPIIGMEAFLAPDGAGRKEAVREGARPEPPVQLVLLCQNREGYGNLVRLSSRSYTEGRQGAWPCVSMEMLEQHHSGLIALTSGAHGVLGRPLLRGDDAKARALAERLGQIFSKRMYVELQDHGLAEEAVLNAQLVALAQQLGLPLVGTNDCHYLEPEESYPHYILQLMGQQKKVTDRDVRPFVDRKLYLKSPQEMAEALKVYPEQAYANAGAIASQCELDLSVHKTYLPRFEIPQDFTEELWFRSQAEQGLARRIEQLEALYGVVAEKREAYWKPYRERLAYELDVIVGMKYAGYFLIVADIINHAKEQGVRVGPGRGSGAGSLVAYALRITDLDPIRNGLLFERFLNPERVSLPDFDIDFAVQGRERVIEYVRSKYGAERVSQISTFGALKAKAALRGVARVLDFPYGQADKIAKLIPNKLNITLSEAIQLEPELARLEQSGTESEQKLIRYGKALELLSSTLSTHAAGVIIMDEPIAEVMPVCTPAKGEGLMQTQYSMKWAEEQGAVKFDFLGLLNLDILSHAQELIRQRQAPGEKPFEIDLVPLDDPATFKLLARGDTGGVFQLESAGMTRMLMDLKPSCFEDIVAMNALYRPGPLGSGMADQFVRRKNGREAIDYIHPKLESVLKETYGVMAYQDQVMQAAQILAGFSLAEADLLRRAMGKKIPQEMAQQRQRFVQGCAASAISAARANEIFEKIDYFSGYGFNKAHSAAYGLITYQTAYLKARYPVEFMAALLSSDMDNTDKVVNTIADCRDRGVQVLPPDVEHSGVDFVLSGNAVRFGLNAVKNVGESAARVILEARQSLPDGRFGDLANFIRTVDLHRVNKRALEALVKCGGFDSIEENRRSLLEGLESLMRVGIADQKSQVQDQESLFALLGDQESAKVDLTIDLPDLPDHPPKERLKLEKEALGFYVSGHPMDGFRSELESLSHSSHEVREGEFNDGTVVQLAGVVASMVLRLTKNAEKFAVLRLEDLRGSLEVVAYPRLYAEIAPLLQLDEPLLVQGRVKVWEERVSVEAERITPLSRFRAENARGVTVRLSSTVPEAAAPRLAGVLAKRPGPCTVSFEVLAEGGHRVRVDAGVKISAEEAVVDELREVLPDAVLRFEYAPEVRSALTRAVRTGRGLVDGSAA